MPKFICLLPIRDEADIIGECLDNLSTWADEIYVFDTGSVDDTWEIVREKATTTKSVIPLKQDHVYFSEMKLRGWMFNHARDGLRNGDWFLRVDADEFHHVPPPDFVRERMHPTETLAYHQYYNFVLRQSEVVDWEEGREGLADRSRPIAERRRWYLVSEYAEPRLCRYRESMKWPPTVSFPFNAGFVAKERLPIRHYPHRDPIQLDRRCRVRAVMMADSRNRAEWKMDYHYWQDTNWRSFVTPDQTAGLKRWTPGTPLAEVSQSNHLPAIHRRFSQWFAHRFLLGLLDARRPPWPADAYPQRIPPEIIDELAVALR